MEIVVKFEKPCTFNLGINKSMDTPIISVNKLSKKFGSFRAVNDISFEVNQSEIFAFLGPNGAGKSTTIKMFITLLVPTSGDAVINGYSLLHHPYEVRKAIGYVPQMISVDGSLTVQENMMLMAQLYDVPYRECKGRIQEMLAFLNLQTHARSLMSKNNLISACWAAPVAPYSASL